ncbi:MAG: GNAT family N-acetyltransferase [Cyanobacteria bacterium P01_A01_bin.17]
MNREMSIEQQITIRKMTPTDIPNVQMLIKQAFEDEGDDYLSDYPILERTRVVVAEYNNDLIGTAVLYHNSFHPYEVGIFVVVAEPHRRQGIGKKLHDAVLQAYPLEKHHLGIQGDYVQEDSQEKKGAGEFLSALGYQLVLDCHCVEMNIENFDFTPYLAIPSQFSSLRIASLEALFLESTKRQEVFDFLVLRYTEEHFWSPPQPKDHPMWKKIISRGVLPELSFALLEGENVVGVVTAVIFDNDTLDMYWGYISRQYSTDAAVALLKCLLAHQFKAAHAHNLYKADLEIDTTDKVISALLNWLPICNDKVWHMLQKPHSDR